MKLAINLTRESVGGITSSSINLINYLYGQDYEFLGVELNARRYMEGPVIFRNFAPEVFGHHIVNIHDLPIIDILKDSRTLADIKRAYQEPIKIIRSIFKKDKPDIVLLSGTYHLPWLISIAAEQENIPIVLRYSGVLMKEIEHILPQIKPLFCSMEKDIVSRVNSIIFPSQLCKDTVENYVTKNSIKNGYVIPNPVANLFTEPCATDYSVARRIAAVGRYTHVKNFDSFFELHTILLKRKWQHTASFVTSHSAKIKKLPKTVDVLPSMNQQGIRLFYASQGLIVCPSKFETFGNVPMEAVCSGIPVLVSDQMGCAEVLKKVGLGNMVISFDDLDKVADRVQLLCGQSILPKQLNALKRILDNKFVSEEIRAVLEGTLGQK